MQQNHLGPLFNLAHLSSLEELNLSGTTLSDLNVFKLYLSWLNVQELEAVLHACTRLSNLQIANTPIAKDSKCREKVISSSTTITILDNKPIHPIERKIITKCKNKWDFAAPDQTFMSARFDTDTR